jgi:uncharacterized membrane protein
LPDWVPIHWNAHGKVDGYARKTFGTLLLPLTNIGIALLMALLPLLDPKFRKHGHETKASVWRTMKIIRIVITGFLAMTSLAVLAVSLKLFKNGAQFSYLMNAGIAVLFVVLGNAMPKLRPNYFVGIRTPWTLASKEVWMKTHRVGGALMMLVGFLMLLLCVVVPLKYYAFWVELPAIGLLTLFLLFYSYLLSKKQASAESVSL